jgi:drug/metabolite transporter (DMT)-like permease
LGFVGITCFQAFLFSAIQLTSAISASVIMALTPAMTACGAAAFTGEHLTGRSIVGTVVAVIGAVIAVLGDNPLGLAGLSLDWGEPLALVAAMCMAFYTAAARRLLRKDVAVFTNTTLVVTISAVFLSPSPFRPSFDTTVCCTVGCTGGCGGRLDYHCLLVLDPRDRADRRDADKCHV